MNQDGPASIPGAFSGSMLRPVAVAGLLMLGFFYLTPNPPGVHYLQYRAAADLLMAGRNPYDLAEQSRVQRSLQDDGPRPFISYNYPPWFALAWAPLSILPYPTAEACCLFLVSLCLVFSGALLHAVASGLSRWATIMVVVGFLPSLFATQTSQTAPVILLLAVVTWRFLDLGRDRLAGFALAWLSIKPQLSVAMILGILIWSARRRRWKVVGSFAITIGALIVASTILDPLWPLQMHRSLNQNLGPLRPEIGVTWPMLLRTVGLTNWRLAIAYGALAFPATAIVVLSAWDRRRAAGDVLDLGAIAVFAIAPYAQFYDFPILLVCLFHLIDNRPPTGPVFGLALALLVLPYFNLLALIVAGWPPCTFAWVPLTLAIARLLEYRASERTFRNQDRIAPGSRRPAGLEGDVESEARDS